MANYTLIEKDGAEVVDDVNRILGEYFKRKQVNENACQPVLETSTALGNTRYTRSLPRLPRQGQGPFGQSQALPLKLSFEERALGTIIFQ